MSVYIEPRVKYEPEPMPLPHSTQRMKFYSVGGDTTGSSVSRILVDNLQNAMLATDETYLNFSIQSDMNLVNMFSSTTGGVTTQATPVYLGHNGASNCIRKLEVISSGNSILTCDNYNMVASVLDVANVPITFNNLGSVTQGSNCGVGDRNQFTYTNDLLGVDVVKSYGALIQAGTEANSGQTPIIRFSYPILGMLSSCLKHIPLDYLHSSLEIQITWESEVRRIFHTLSDLNPVESSSKLRVMDVNLDCRVNSYEQASMDVINKVNGWSRGNDPMNWCGFQYKVSLGNISTTQQGVTGKIETLIPNSRYKSLQSIIYGSFPTNIVTAGVEHGCGSAGWMPFIGVSSQQYRLGSHLLPNSKIVDLPDACSSTQSCFSVVNKALSGSQMNNQLSGTILNQRQGNTYTTQNPRGVIGVDVTTFGDSNRVIGGYDTTNLSVTSLQDITNATATFNQQVCYVSKIMVLYQMNPDDGRISCSF
jgi:hypothetical protein